jgi:O-6-methylguanine DNA methyltransferase
MDVAMRELQDDGDLFGDELRRVLSPEAETTAPASVLPVVLAGVGLADAYAPVETAIGALFVAYNDRGVSWCGRPPTRPGSRPTSTAASVRPARRLDRLPRRLAGTVEHHLAGEGRSTLRFDLRGRSAFERAVLVKAGEIPRGEVRPYAWVAREIGRPGAARAVGGALAANPVPLLIPCHRVVRSDGRIDGYIFGTDAKRRALATEGVEAESLEELAFAGVRLLGSDTTRVYCYPTCRNARRITAAHRVPFASLREAAGAGYRPCKVCRPAVAA